MTGGSGSGSLPGGGSSGSFGPPMGSGGSSAAGGTSDDRPPVVNWNPANQGYWFGKTTVFTGRNGNTSPTNVPTTHQVMYLQEDLWVLEAVFSVIKGVNGDADANDLANIKTIDHILVGPSAGELGKISSLDETASVPSGMAGGNSRNMSMDMMKSMSGSGASSGANANKPAPSADPAHRRYVDRDYKLLESTAFHSALTASSPSEAYLQVAKRIPVRLGFQMKEAALIDLLAQCANSNPPIEVRQVRINRHKPEAGSDGEGGSGSGGGANPAGGMPVMAGMGGGGASMSLGDPSRRGGRSNQAEAPSADVIGVEIYGVVYIFNPVPDETDPNDILKLANPEPANNQAADRSRPVVPVTAG